MLLWYSTLIYCILTSIVSILAIKFKLRGI